jgi:hypothetical protein
MKAPPIARSPAVVLLGMFAGIVGIASLSAAAPGCTDGTTPVCDDGGSCLLSSSGDAGGGVQDAAGPADDGPIE